MRSEWQSRCAGLYSTAILSSSQTTAGGGILLRGGREAACAAAFAAVCRAVCIAACGEVPAASRGAAAGKNSSFRYSSITSPSHRRSSGAPFFPFTLMRRLRNDLYISEDGSPSVTLLTNRDRRTSASFFPAIKRFIRFTLQSGIRKRCENVSSAKNPEKEGAVCGNARRSPPARIRALSAGGAGRF